MAFADGAPPPLLEDVLQWKTFLAPKVQHLICKIGGQASPSSFPSSGILQPSGLICWETLTEVAFRDEYDSWDTQSEFVEMVGRLAPICKEIHDHIISLTDDEFREKYGSWFDWTGYPQVFLAAFNQLKADDMRRSLVGLLLTTSALERALGDVYLLKNQPCPSLLKDLLVTPELQSLFSIPALFCLRVLMGPPTSLNLRNIVWHGFALPGEIPPRYSSFLLVLAASLGQMLHERGIHPDGIVHRPQLDLCKQSQCMKDAFPVHETNTTCLNTILRACTFLSQPHHSMLDLAVQYYSSERFGWCIVVLCPLIEHLIRIMFASANGCPERVLTAESTVLFTTFDEMLCAELPGGSGNMLISAISEPYMELLLDLLVHPEGPRLRDRISHGEVDLEMVPRELASFTLCSCLACWFQAEGPDRRSVLEKHTLMAQVQDCARSYTSVFHPAAICKHLISSLVSSLSNWSSLPRPASQDLVYNAWPAEPEDGAIEPRSNDSELVSQIVNTWLWSCNQEEHHIEQCVLYPFTPMTALSRHLTSLCLQTLFRPRKELEVIGLLHNIANQCLTVNKQVCHLATLRFNQFGGKELRSRQRANYQRFLNRMPRIGFGIRVAVLLLISHLSILSQVSIFQSRPFLAMIKFLKAVLQYAENLASQTSMERNRWDEADHLTTDFLQRVTSYLAKLDQQRQESVERPAKLPAST